jgi:hypothetical protein
MTLVGSCLVALLWWAEISSLLRLAVFFVVYAVSFGNHLSMVLLAPGFVLFLALESRDGPRALLRPRVVLLALAIAITASLQYWWNVQGLLDESPHPRGWLDTARIFWFDTTKADWRESLVGGVHPSRVGERLEMYWFEIRQQFGVIGVMLAAAGLARLFATDRAPGSMLLVHYLVTAGFAFGYNVGDSHVFFLTSHWIVAALMAPTVGLAVSASTWQRLTGRPGRLPAVIATLAVLAYPLLRITDAYPALDRSADRRPMELFDSLTKGLTGERTIFGTHLDWQTQNGLSYYARYYRPDLVWFRIVEVLPHFPVLVRDNLAVERTVTLTPEAAMQIRAAYGDLFAIEEDPTAEAPALTERLAAIRAGELYVLAVLEPTSDRALDVDAIDRAAVRLGGQRLSPGRYSVMAGVGGRSPAIRVGSDRPFRRRVDMEGLAIDVRVESWIPFDTIRRSGYGQVIVNGRKALTLERGLSFAGFGADGRVFVSGYEGGLYAPRRRYVVTRMR